MKRTSAAVLAVFLFAVSTFAAETHRYVVGVKAHRTTGEAVARRALTQDGNAGSTLTSRNFSDFRFIDAFAADLTDDEARNLAMQPEVKFVEREMPVYAFERPAARVPFKPTVELRDPSVQTIPWGIPAVHATDTWSAVRGDDINVAIIDTGIDYTHPDLKDRYAGGYNAVCASNTTCKSTTQINDPLDDNGHGTHVAGIIGATDNSIGVVGVAPHVKIWSVKVLGSDGSGSTATIASGINWVVSKKAEVGGDWIVNMSLGICADPTDSTCATTPPASMLTACQKAADAGVLIFAASGNDSTAASVKPVGYPAAFPSVVAVGATDVNNAIADFSNQGPELALVAPGVEILSTYPVGKATNAFVAKSGTMYNADAIIGSKKDGVTGQFVFCGFGGSASEFPAAVKGNIALIERGNGITFNAKTKNALSAGATAVVIYNCSKTASPSTCTNDSESNWTLIGKLADGVTDNPSDLSFAWPLSIGVSNSTGLTLKADPGATISAYNQPDDYTYLSGTSMAAPHAVGVAALVWSAAPAATANDVRSAMVNTAIDLGASGRDNVFGFGLVDAYAAAKSIAPQLFGTPATPPPTEPTPSTGRRILKRG